MRRRSRKIKLDARLKRQHRFEFLQNIEKVGYVKQGSAETRQPSQASFWVTRRTLAVTYAMELTQSGDGNVPVISSPAK
jgi:ribosomal protein S19E (S16A)